MREGVLYTGRKGTIRAIKQGEIKGAKFSSCRKYRYKLWRIWDRSKPLALCIGINPSSADENKDDPTIRNLRTALSNLGFGGFYIMNLFSFISSEPKDLLTAKDPFGSLHNNEFFKTTEKVSEVIFCWGSGKKVKGFDRFDEEVAAMKYAYPEASCFGINLDGSPMHPMTLMYKGLINKAKLHAFRR